MHVICYNICLCVHVHVFFWYMHKCYLLLVTPMETTATDSDSKKRRLRSSQKKNRDTDPMPEESDESPVKGRKRQECGDTEDDGGTIGTEESKSSGHIDCKNHVHVLVMHLWNEGSFDITNLTIKLSTWHEL